MTPSITARESYNRRLDRLNRQIKHAALRADYEAAERLNDLYLFVRSERDALEHVRRAGR